MKNDENDHIQNEKKLFCAMYVRYFYDWLYRFSNPIGSSNYTYFNPIIPWLGVNVFINLSETKFDNIYINAFSNKILYALTKKQLH